MPLEGPTTSRPPWLIDAIKEETEPLRGSRLLTACRHGSLVPRRMLGWCLLRELVCVDRASRDAAPRHRDRHKKQEVSLATKIKVSADATHAAHTTSRQCARRLRGIGR